MEKTITIEGMMCGHCEATVKKALEALDGVISADVSHDKGTAVVALENDVADDILVKTVEERRNVIPECHVNLVRNANAFLRGAFQGLPYACQEIQFGSFDIIAIPAKIVTTDFPLRLNGKIPIRTFLNNSNYSHTHYSLNPCLFLQSP